MATIGWYGPLINLSEASSHIGHFVQLLVFVHKTLPVQYKTSGGGKVIRTDIQVGDETRPYFPVSIWNKHMESMLKAGNVVLLQNVKVTKYGDAVEARTVQQSSLKCLADSYESISFEGANNWIKDQHIGIASKEKLKKLIAWVPRVAPILDTRVLNPSKRKQKSANWKFPEEMQHKDCLSLLEVSNLNDSCNASFSASVGEMFLPMHLPEYEEERMFIRSRICSSMYGNLAEDLICTGCQLCGAPLNSEFGSRIEQKTVPLYCQISSNRLHVAGLIYRPFLTMNRHKKHGVQQIVYLYQKQGLESIKKGQKIGQKLRERKGSTLRLSRGGGVAVRRRGVPCSGPAQRATFGDLRWWIWNLRSGMCEWTEQMERKLYVWDDSTYIPIVIKNKAAEILFGNIKAESVHSSYRKKARGQSINEGMEDQCRPGPKFYSLLLILLKTLLQPGKNSPLKFKVRVDMTKSWDNGRFEMMSLSLPLIFQNAN